MSDNDNLTNDMMDRIAKMLKEDRLPIKDTIILNPKWQAEVEQTTQGAPYKRTGQLHGINIVYSPHVETGKVYMMNRPKYAPPPIDFDYSRFEQAFRTQISAVFGIPYRYFEQTDTQWQREVTYNWQRFPDETLLAWGERLADKGLLDNPQIRWEYQKAILGAPFAKLKAVWIRFR